MERVQLNGPRSHPPSQLEVLSVLSHNPYHHSQPISIPVHLPNSSYQVSQSFPQSNRANIIIISAITVFIITIIIIITILFRLLFLFPAVNEMASLKRRKVFECHLCHVMFVWCLCHVCVMTWHDLTWWSDAFSLDDVICLSVTT